jgi:hypothetical protein
MIKIKKELEKNSNKIILGSLIVGIAGIIMVSYLHSSHTKKKPLDKLKNFIDNLNHSLECHDNKENNSHCKKHENKSEHFERKATDILELVSFGINLLNKITKRK